MKSNSTGPGSNNLFPQSIGCVGDKDGDMHGAVAAADSVAVSAGAEDACIYRIER